MVAFKSKQVLGGLVLAAFAAVAQAEAQFLTRDPIDEVLEGIGLKSPDRDSIDYRERAPLVVPPTSGKLRTPEENASARNGQWPQDPDVLARRKRAEQARMPSGYQVNETRDKLLVGPNEGRVRNNMAGVPTRGGTPGENLNPATILTPDQVGRIMANASDKPSTPGAEPTRSYLTEPPKGYRRAAPGVKLKATVEPMPNQGDQVQMNIQDALR